MPLALPSAAIGLWLNGTVRWLLAARDWALQGHLVLGRCRDTWWLDWALQGHLVVGRCRDTWWLGTAGTLGGWALQGYLVVGHCKILWLGIARTLCGWARQEHLVVGRCRDTPQLSAAGTCGGEALQGCSAVGPCSKAPGGGQGQHILRNLTTPLRRWGSNQAPGRRLCPFKLLRCLL